MARTENDPAHLAYMRAYGPRRRAARAAAGLCTKCGGEKGDTPGKLCAPCKDDARDAYARSTRARTKVRVPITSIAVADSEAKRRWGYRGVAVIGRCKRVGYFDFKTPDDPNASPPYPWTVCGEGETWEEAFAQADGEAQSR